MPKKKKKATPKAEKREVQRQHVWRPGHDPNDPDADPASGWTYLKITGDTPAETRDLRNKYKMGGGPESGMPCWCGEMTRIVEEVSVLEVLEQQIVLNGEQAKIEFSDEQKKRFRDERLAILMCPRCETIHQVRADMARLMRQRWLEKQAA